MHTHADGVRSGFTGVGKIHQRQAVEPLLRMSLNSLQAGAPRLREGSHCRTVAIAESDRCAAWTPDCSAKPGMAFVEGVLSREAVGAGSFPGDPGPKAVRFAAPWRSSAR